MTECRPKQNNEEVARAAKAYHQAYVISRERYSAGEMAAARSGACAPGERNNLRALGAKLSTSSLGENRGRHVIGVVMQAARVASALCAPLWLQQETSAVPCLGGAMKLAR